jgi:hypothetical protein
MNEPSPDFYVAGGAMKADAPSYIERKADTDLFSALLSGQFCYVLTTRQMGKSSLMERISTRLQDKGVSCVNLDLAHIGQNLTVDQWYFGLLSEIGEQLEVEDELSEFWQRNKMLGPLHRWLQAIRERRSGALKSSSRNLH